MVIDREKVKVIVIDIDGQVIDLFLLDYSQQFHWYYQSQKK